MTPEERELLDKSVRLGEENNQILRSMRRSQRLASIARATYWIIIIGSAVGAFYLLQPYIDKVKNVYSGANDVLNSFKQIGQ